MNGHALQANCAARPVLVRCSRPTSVSCSHMRFCMEWTQCVIIAWLLPFTEKNLWTNMHARTMSCTETGGQLVASA